jgi:hypothetical protein
MDKELIVKNKTGFKSIGKPKLREKLSFKEIDRASDLLAEAISIISDDPFDDPVLGLLETAQKILLRGTEFNKIDKVGDPLPEAPEE